jgi:DNA-binding transcriptional MerR regulator
LLSGFGISIKHKIMNNYKLKDVVNHTGLKADYVNKCLKHLKLIISPHASRGKDNCWIFTSSGVVIFDQIKQLKDRGFTLPEIEKQLLDSINQTKNQQIVESKQTKTTIYTAETNQEIINLMREHQHEIKEETEKRIRIQTELTETIRGLEKENQSLSGALKLLPEGKTPEQIKEEWELEQKRKLEVAKVMGELKTIGVLRFLKKKKLIKKLEELLES